MLSMRPTTIKTDSTSTFFFHASREKMFVQIISSALMFPLKSRDRLVDQDTAKKMESQRSNFHFSSWRSPTYFWNETNVVWDKTHRYNSLLRLKLKILAILWKPVNRSFKAIVFVGADTVMEAVPCSSWYYIIYYVLWFHWSVIYWHS